MKLNVFCWYDKIDKVYMRDSVVVDRSTRAVCRGYLQSFQKNKMMNYKEFSLVQIGEFDDETGIINAFDKPVEVDPTIVFDKSEENLKENESVDL